MIHDEASANAATTLELDIVSDSICPWCYIGKRRLEAALRLLAADGIAVEVNWRPFQLNPDMPKEGVDRRAYRTAKFGSWENSQARDRQVADAAATVGLTFRLDLLAKTPNTLASHALIRLAREIGGPALQDAIVEAIFAAYFTQGRDIGDPSILADLAQPAGIDRQRTLAFLADPASTAAVDAEEASARDLGLSGVPSFVLDGHFLFSGAHPPETIAAALRRASAFYGRGPAISSRATAQAAV